MGKTRYSSKTLPAYSFVTGSCSQFTQMILNCSTYYKLH